MKRLLILITIQLVVAALSLVNMAAFFLAHLLEPSRPATKIALYGSLYAVALLTIVIIAVSIWNRERPMAPHWLAIAAGSTLIVGFIPWTVDAGIRWQDDLEIRSDNLRAQNSFLNELESRKRDVEARIAAREAYSSDQAFYLISFVAGSDLRYHSLPDYSTPALALLQGALKGGIVDPNGRLEGKEFQDLRGEPIFAYFYKVRIEGGSARANDWKVLELLLDNGVDLTREDAKAALEELRKKKSLGPSG